MKTRCPECQTVFRVTPEQLKARAGKVRCGQCQFVFNALDELVEETPQPAPLMAVAPLSVDVPATIQWQSPEPEQPPAEADAAPPEPGLPPTEADAARPEPELPPTEADAARPEPELPPTEADARPEPGLPPTEADAGRREADPAFEILLEPVDSPRAVEAEASVPHVEPILGSGELPPLSESEAQELGKATGLIAPREMTDVPGYSKWSEGVMAPIAAPPEKSARWPFVAAAIVLILVLLIQIVFQFRSDIAVAAPFSRPVLEALSRAFNADIPLPRHADLVSIEASDLQNDATNGQQLVLNATLRNRAGYEQAYPFLELTLTDTQDATIARRVFTPAEYLPPKRLADERFAGGADVAVRLWIEATEMTPAGYRLYVFYP